MVENGYVKEEDLDREFLKAPTSGKPHYDYSGKSENRPMVWGLTDRTSPQNSKSHLL
jgi:hypothetical protein